MRAGHLAETLRIIEAMRWQVFCHVVDNFGDIGFAWRLAADLAARGEPVRFIVDDASALAWLAPHGAAGVEVEPWPGSDDGWADVAVETFGCGMPPRRAPARVSINVEHLSAEPFVERSHGLPSPRPGCAPSGSTTTWLYYPGFTERTGGLLREAALIDRVEARPAAGAPKRVVIFSYANDALAELFELLGNEPTHALVCPGAAADAARAALGPSLARAGLQAMQLPFVAQPEFDRLLASAELAFVRGEDSLVRAIWAGRPFVWQLYRQADGALAAKLEAFLDCFLESADDALAGSLRTLFRRWNGLSKAPLVLPDMRLWQQHCRRWRAHLAAPVDLTTRLIGFAAARR